MADSRAARADPPPASLLAHLQGAVPPPPAWFKRALAHAPERSFTPVAGAAIETLAWGEVGKPGLLFLHGNGAHADWWSFIAPHFATEHRVAALSWSGMGGSDWRARYTLDTHADEAFAVAEACGLFEAAEKPVFVGHSYGGYALLLAAARKGERLKAAVVVDSAIRAPAEPEWTPPPPRAGHRIYPTLEAALARFRFAPPQSCDNLFIADFIARASLKSVGSGEGEGWTWRFDPALWGRVDLGDLAALLRTPRCPLAQMLGERSRLMPPVRRAFLREAAPAGSPWTLLPDADHHVMVDQPLAFVGALRALLAGWP